VTLESEYERAETIEDQMPEEEHTIVPILETPGENLPITKVSEIQDEEKAAVTPKRSLEVESYTPSPRPVRETTVAPEDTQDSEAFAKIESTERF
jgi:hypothetical protein